MIFVTFQERKVASRITFWFMIKKASRAELVGKKLRKKSSQEEALIGAVIVKNKFVRLLKKILVLGYVQWLI